MSLNINGGPGNRFTKENLTKEIIDYWVDYNPETGELLNKRTGKQIKPIVTKCNDYQNSTICFNRSYFGSKFFLYYLMTGEKIKEVTDLFYVNGNPKDLRWENIERKDFDDPEILDKWINRKIRKNLHTEENKLHGFGINDLDYNIVVRRDGKTIFTCPYHNLWSNIVLRCYHEETIKKHPTYAECEMCDDWAYASVFKKWMEKQDWEGKEIDKDILNGHRSQYNPDNCIFVDSYINGFFSFKDNVSGKYPVGVNKRNKENCIKPFRARIGIFKRIHLGDFYTPEEAHGAWQLAKIQRCEDLMKEYKEDPNVIQGLERLRDQIKFEYDNGLVTKGYS